MKRRKTRKPMGVPAAGEVYDRAGSIVLVLSAKYGYDMWGDWWSVSCLREGSVVDLDWRPGDTWDWKWGPGNVEGET